MTLQRSGGSSVGLGTKQRHQILVLPVESIRKGAVVSWFGRMNAILQRVRRVRDCPQSRSLRKRLLHQGVTTPSSTVVAH